MIYNEILATFFTVLLWNWSGATEREKQQLERQRCVSPCCWQAVEWRVTDVNKGVRENCE